MSTKCNTKRNQAHQKCSETALRTVQQ